MMKIAKIVSWHFIYNDQYYIEIDLNSGVFEVWLWRKDIGVKDLLFGVKSSDTNYTDIVNMAESYINANNCIEYYEENYVDLV